MEKNKKIIVIAFAIIAILLFELRNYYKKEEEKPTTIVGEFEVMKSDLGCLTWDDANTKAKELGNGWRLPTIEEFPEFAILYKEKIQLNGHYYWTSTPSDNYSYWVWDGIFNRPKDDFKEFYYGGGTAYVRLIRNVKN